MKRRCCVVTSQQCVQPQVSAAFARAQPRRKASAHGALEAKDTDGLPATTPRATLLIPELRGRQSHGTGSRPAGHTESSQGNTAHLQYKKLTSSLELGAHVSSGVGGSDGERHGRLGHRSGLSTVIVRPPRAGEAAVSRILRRFPVDVRWPALPRAEGVVRLRRLLLDVVRHCVARREGKSDQTDMPQMRLLALRCEATRQSRRWQRQRGAGAHWRCSRMSG